MRERKRERSADDGSLLSVVSVRRMIGERERGPARENRRKWKEETGMIETRGESKKYGNRERFPEEEREK